MYPYTPYGTKFNYFKGAIGAGIAGYSRGRSQSIIQTRPGAGTASQSYKKRPRTGKRNNIVTQIRGMETAQHLLGDDNVVSQNILHGDFYAHSPTTLIALGTGNSKRTGDEIYLNALKFRINFSDSTAITNGVLLRVWIGYTNTQTTATNFASYTGTDSMFSTGTFYSTGSIVDPKRFTCLYDSTSEINNTVAGTNSVLSIADTVQLNKPFPYETGSVYGKEKNLIVIVTGTTIGGTISTTVLGQILLSYDLIFKNSK